MVYIPSGQANQEDTAKNALAGVTGLLSPTPDCMDDLFPYLCLSLFGVCTASGEIVRPSSGQCERLRSDVCVTEWARAEAFVSSLPPEAAAQFSFLQCGSLTNHSTCDCE